MFVGLDWLGKLRLCHEVDLGSDPDFDPVKWDKIVDSERVVVKIDLKNTCKAYGGSALSGNDGANAE